MPSTSEAFRPASSMALRTAQVPSARVVTPEPRVYVVSPTPTMAYLSRRYLGLVASTSGIAMASSWIAWAPPYDGAGLASGLPQKDVASRLQSKSARQAGG